MENSNPQNKFLRGGFTLIELLVVIAIIGILAALTFSIIGIIDKRKKISLAQAELEQIQTAIEGYKTKLDFYPPDNPNSVFINQLYFELLGTTNNNAPTVTDPLYVTLDVSGQIKVSEIVNVIGASAPGAPTGIANSTTSGRSTGEETAARAFLSHLRSSQIGQVDTNKPLIKILVCSIPWPENIPQVINPPAPPGLNPWCYNSSHPTNNSGSFDLWVDLIIKGKTYRVSNWSKQPIIL